MIGSHLHDFPELIYCTATELHWSFIALQPAGLQGSYGSWKTWKVMEFRISFSRPGKSWNLSVGDGKSWKMTFIVRNKLGSLFFVNEKAKIFWNCETFRKQLVNFRSWKAMEFQKSTKPGTRDVCAAVITDRLKFEHSKPLLHQSFVYRRGKKEEYLYKIPCYEFTCSANQHWPEKHNQGGKKDHIHLLTSWISHGLPSLIIIQSCCFDYR